MTLGLVGALVEAISNGPEGAKYRSISMAGVSPKTGDIFIDERTFQFWPESLSDTIEVGWSFKDIPGMSSALAQWSSNNGRTISFEVHFSRFMKPVEKRSKPFETFLPGPNNTIPEDALKYNVDIVREIKWLRAFCYPFYELLDGYTTASSPVVAILCVPGHALGDAKGEDCIYAVMTGCDVTYMLAFPDGTPRRASVALTFKQIVQDPINKSIYTVGHDGDSGAKFGQDAVAETGIGYAWRGDKSSEAWIDNPTGSGGLNDADK